MPIHPIGIKEKKGTLGCPYAIKDYRDVNPNYGTMDEFKELVDQIRTKNGNLNVVLTLFEIEKRKK